MSDKSIRIRTTPNETPKYLKVKLEQDFDFIEILSLRISQAEAYARFCSDYGVIVGRVIVNDGFGVPNAKVSVFIPIEDEDKGDSEILGLYPFENIDDKGGDGARYNLLPKDGDPYNTCYTPVGSFPSKREVLDNDTVLEVYCKYYKFTTTTNDAGDFMLFGVPTGNHVVNVDVDLSDIGVASQRPYDYISQGDDIKKFYSPNKFRGDKDLDKLLQVKTFKKGVNVQPFWGDTDQCDIGITRLDVDLKQRIIPSAIFIGSMFADTEKNSVNKHCRPRKDLGRICETETGEGTIEMIRRTLDGGVERFDVEGGRVIDEFGTWAYQVPMNLDYMVTDEFGNLVLSDDPNKGIATRASVRFRISKDVSGSEGRLRTTAKYLVPHNPASSSEIDYNFDENTRDISFRNFHWNKIYTVSNFIPRLQGTCIGNACADNRNITGIKDVDDCTGMKTPFPFNRVDTDFNPLFLIICIILSIVMLVIWLINAVIVTLINIIIWTLNIILKIICETIFLFARTICGLVGAITFGFFDSDKCKEAGCMNTYSNGSCDCNNIIGYVPCINMVCDTQRYAPGCDCSGSGILNIGCTEATNSFGTIDHWSGLAYFSNSCANGGHDGHNQISAGLTDCYAIQIAEALDMFEFDFYNDWINGTLYSYLLKYKKKKNGKRKFCDIECDSSDSDNGCHQSYFIDTCKENDNSRGSIKLVTKKGINEGYIKLVTKKLPNGVEVEDLYYAPYSTDVNAKLFATELVHLGSVFDCDWQGIPKIQPYLTSTSYKRPPYTDEYTDNGIKLVCGMSSTGSNGKSGLFFDIDCLGLTVGQIDTQSYLGTPSRCNNFKRICEHGVDLDEADITANGTVISSCNCYINGDEIIQPWGDKFRDVFAQLNMNDGPSKLDSWPITGLPLSFDTSFGTGVNASGVQYLQFRDGNAADSNSYNTTSPSTGQYKQPKNSFYFYFGSMPNRSAVELMNRRFFNECKLVIPNDFIISGQVAEATGSNSCDGSINLTVVGGSGSYTYQWSGPNGFTSTLADPYNLCGGNYTVTVTDTVNGGSSTTTFTVNAPSPLSCNITSSNAINAGGNGNIYINVFGGSSPYTYSINGGTPVTFNTQSETIPTPAGTYTVVVTDFNGDSCSAGTGVTITQPPVLSLGSQVTWTHTTCGNDNGTITVVSPSQLTIGGIPPYQFNITGPNSYSSFYSSAVNLEAGTYTVSVSDTSPIPQTDSQTVTINPSLEPVIVCIPSYYCWIYPNVAQIFPTLSVIANGAFTIEATPRDAFNQPILSQTITQSFGAGSTPVTMSAPSSQPFQALMYDFKLTDSDGCIAYSFSDFRPGQGQVPSNALRLQYINPTDKFCWTTTGGKQVIAKFRVYVDGPFTIKEGTTVLYNELVGVPAGTVITINLNPSPSSSNTYTFTLVDDTHPSCTYTETINFTPQLPTSALNVNISQAANLCVSSPPAATTISANVSGGWGPYTYLWIRNTIPTTNTSSSVTIPNTECGQTWECVVTDSNNCVQTSTRIIT